jgi:hypothetical protein
MWSNPFDVVGAILLLVFGVLFICGLFLGD